MFYNGANWVPGLPAQHRRRRHWTGQMFGTNRAIPGVAVDAVNPSTCTWEVMSTGLHLPPKSTELERRTTFEDRSGFGMRGTLIYDICATRDGTGSYAVTIGGVIGSTDAGPHGALLSMSRLRTHGRQQGESRSSVRCKHRGISVRSTTGERAGLRMSSASPVGVQCHSCRKRTEPVCVLGTTAASSWSIERWTSWHHAARPSTCASITALRTSFSAGDKCMRHFLTTPFQDQQTGHQPP